MLIKRGVCVLLFLIVLVTFSSLASATLGISPASIKKDFDPNMQEKIEYSVSSDKPNTELVAYKKGDLAEYIDISKTSLYGEDRFNVKMDLPEELDHPGEHRSIIGVKEKVDEELATVGTSLAVQSVLEIYVPFPGKYLESSVEADSVNQGEISEIFLDIDNKGKQAVSMKPRIEIMNKENTTVDTIELSRREIERHGNIKLKGDFNTSGYKPGDYMAKAIVDYAGKNSTSTDEFSIGHLFVNVTNQTKKAKVGGTREFDVEVESRWADEIKNVYADVEIIENVTSRKTFRTTPESLDPWESAELTGYFDTTNMSLGTQDTRIFVKYEGEETVREGKIELYQEKKGLIGNVGYIVLGIIFIIVITLIIWFIRRRKSKNEKN